MLHSPLPIPPPPHPQLVPGCSHAFPPSPPASMAGPQMLLAAEEVVVGREAVFATRRGVGEEDPAGLDDQVSSRRSCWA